MISPASSGSAELSMNPPELIPQILSQNSPQETPELLTAMRQAMPSTIFSPQITFNLSLPVMTCGVRAQLVPKHRSFV